MLKLVLTFEVRTQRLHNWHYLCCLFIADTYTHSAHRTQIAQYADNNSWNRLQADIVPLLLLECHCVVANVYYKWRLYSERLEYI